MTYICHREDCPALDCDWDAASCSHACTCDGAAYLQQLDDAYDSMNEEIIQLNNSLFAEKARAEKAEAELLNCVRGWRKDVEP